MRARVALWIVSGVVAGIAGQPSLARADHQPVIALPGNAQVPVVIDGMPATGAWVNGDWGLYAPGSVTPEVLPPVLWGPVLAPYYPDPGYFPRTGRRPRYGRPPWL